MAKKKSTGKDRKRKKITKKRKSTRTKKKKIKKKKIKKKKGKKKKDKKKPKKKPKGPSWGPWPLHPEKGTKKWPGKKTKKWPPKRKRPKDPDTGTDNNDLLQYSDFAPHVGTFFQLTDFDPPLQIELIEVAELDPTEIPDELEEDVREQPFSLLLEGPLNVDLVQDVYTVQHNTIETMVLLLVPVGPPVSAGDFQIILQAVFA